MCRRVEYGDVIGEIVDVLVRARQDEEGWTDGVDWVDVFLDYGKVCSHSIIVCAVFWHLFIAAL